MSTTLLVVGAVGLLIGSAFKSIVGDEIKVRLQEAAKVLPWLASWVIPREDREDFRVDYCSELEAIGADTLHPLTRLVRAYLFGISMLVRSPLIRRRFVADRPTIEMVAPPPRWLLQIWRTRFIFSRGMGIPVENAQNSHFTFVYRVQRTGTIDGRTTLVSIGFGHGWHFTILTMPWPGRMGMMIPRTRIAIVRNGVPVLGVVKKRI